MTEKEVLDFHVLERKKFNLLSEVMDLSKQIGQSVDRNDEVTVRMLLGLRQEPIAKLDTLKSTLAEKMGQLPEDEMLHMREVLGGRDSKSKAEEGLRLQALETSKLLSQVL